MYSVYSVQDHHLLKGLSGCSVEAVVSEHCGFGETRKMFAKMLKLQFLAHF